MFAIVGAAGKIGYATAAALRKAGLPVRAILRDPSKADRLRALGCEVALADLQNPGSLGRAIANAHTVQIICPPIPQATDIVSDMRRSMESLAVAVDRARPDLFLAISDYGAHVESDIGMPTLFRYFEERLRMLHVPKIFLRSAEHMEGWGAVVPMAVAAGVLPSFHSPVEKTFPTISAGDVGVIAADLLLHPSAVSGERLVHAEGPRRYSALDVAKALSELLGRAVTAQAVPREQWMVALNRVVSESAAQVLIDLYDAHNMGGIVDVDTRNGEVKYGTTELIEALRPMVPAEVRAA